MLTCPKVVMLLVYEKIHISSSCMTVALLYLQSRVGYDVFCIFMIRNKINIKEANKAGMFIV